MWYRKNIGRDRCPIVDTWWQTETGAIMISPVPGAVPAKPGSATRPLPGIIVDVVDRQGNSVGTNQGGFLVIKQPWPSMLRTIYGDPERYKKQYWSEIPGVYFTGDGARRDEDGYFWIMGRIDDVINVSGHRIGTMEVESSLVSHPTVAEAAVVGRPDEMKGQGIVAFVTLAAGFEPQPLLKDDLQSACCQDDREFREAGRDSIYGFPPENAERQNHATLAARSGLGQRNRWRYDNTGRLFGPGEIERRGRQARYLCNSGSDLSASASWENRWRKTCSKPVFRSSFTIGAARRSTNWSRKALPRQCHRKKLRPRQT